MLVGPVPFAGSRRQAPRACILTLPSACPCSSARRAAWAPAQVLRSSAPRARPACRSCFAAGRAELAGRPCLGLIDRRTRMSSARRWRPASRSGRPPPPRSRPGKPGHECGCGQLAPLDAALAAEHAQQLLGSAPSRRPTLSSNQRKGAGPPGAISVRAGRPDASPRAAAGRSPPVPKARANTRASAAAMSPPSGWRAAPPPSRGRRR